MGRTHRGWTTVLAMGAIAAYSPQRSRCAIRQSLAGHSFHQYLAILHLLHLRSCSGIPVNVQLKAQHRLSHSCGSPFGPSTKETSVVNCSTRNVPLLCVFVSAMRTASGTSLHAYKTTNIVSKKKQIVLNQNGYRQKA